MPRLISEKSSDADIQQHRRRVDDNEGYDYADDRAREQGTAPETGQE
jgi:hypothetical protein